MDNSKFTSHADEVLAELNRKAGMILTAIGEKAEGYAKDDCPVDTGNLRNSISNAVNDDEKFVAIGTNVDYAVYVEFNDYVNHVNGKAHFLRDSATTHGAEYERIANQILKN